MNHRPSIVFFGRRQKHMSFVTITTDGKTYMLPRYENFYCVSHQPFEWGRRSAAAEQLAYAITVEVFGIERARRLHSQVYIHLISTLVGETWELTGDRVRECVKEVPIQGLMDAAVVYQSQ